MSKAEEILEAVTKIDPRLIQKGKEQIVELWKVENGKFVKKDVGYAKQSDLYAQQGYFVIFPLKKRQADQLKKLG